MIIIFLAFLHAYAQDYQHLLTQPSNPEIGVTTSDCGGCW